MVYLGNAFSLQMLKNKRRVRLICDEMPAERVSAYLQSHQFKSIIGHDNTAGVLTKLLGVDVWTNRESIELDKGDILVVAQYSKGRIIDRELEQVNPDDFTFWVVRIQ